jgi:hypothetical protein
VNRVGPETVPCGTPRSMSRQLECIIPCTVCFTCFSRQGAFSPAPNIKIPKSSHISKSRVQCVPLCDYSSGRFIFTRYHQAKSRVRIRRRRPKARACGCEPYGFESSTTNYFLLLLSFSFVIKARRRSEHSHGGLFITATTHTSRERQLTTISFTIKQHDT